MDNPALEKRVPPSEQVIFDRIRGTIFGAICANSLGGSAVGLNFKEIAGTVGLSGLRDFAPGLSRSLLPDHQAGDLLADAYLGLALGESLVGHGGRLDKGDLKQRFEKLLTDPDFLSAGPGVPCVSALRRMVDGEAPTRDEPESTHGNAVSRVFPAGCLPGAGKTEEPVNIAIQQARLTHGDERAAAAAAVIADSISYFIYGGLMDSVNDVRAYVRRELEIANRFDQRFAEAWDDIAPDLDYGNPATELPYSLINVQSSVNELAPTAVGIFLIFRHSAEEAICAAARSGGDTDRVAAIVGALSGAYHGVAGIPERWLSKIKQKSRIEELCDGFSKLW